MINIAICDDNLDTTKTMQKIFNNEIIKQDLDARITVATDKQDVIYSLIEKGKIDLLILDVEFENSTLNGIEFAKKLRKVNNDFYLVYLSAHQCFLYPSVVTKIFDYLVKPTNEEVIKELVSRIKLEFNNSSCFLQINKWEQVKINEIIYIEKSINKSIIHTENLELFCNKTLSSLQKELPNKFSRCYKSYIVNKEKIVSINKKDRIITLENNIILPINNTFIV